MSRLYICIAFLGIGICCCAGASAQTFEEYRQKAVSEYADYKGGQQRDFAEYRKKINDEFADYMRQAWEPFEVQPAEEMPERPEPPAPVVKQPDAKPDFHPVRYNNIVSQPEPIVSPPAPLPVAKRPELPEQRLKPVFRFQFFGTPCAVPLDESMRFVLKGVDENSVADTWEKLSSEQYLPLIDACLSLRDQLQLCDWAYVLLLEEISKTFFSPEQSNEATLFQMYILTQSGYKTRIARTGSRLVLLLPSLETIYQYPYLTIGNCKYYVLNSSDKGGSYYVFNREFPNEQYFSLQIKSEPQLAYRPSVKKTFKPSKNPGLVAAVCVNLNLIDFYDAFPINNSWDSYTRTALSSSVKEQLYPILERSMAGKNELQKANLLIDFVQTAFDYKTDGEQFGYERPLFADETFYYPYCDCEDRAILYSVLVRDLLGCEVVLLEYPGHVATAVHFNMDFSGDYLTIDGRKYTVCDPTYIGASIGETMPQFVTTPVKVIRID